MSAGDIAITVQSCRMRGTTITCALGVTNTETTNGSASLGMTKRGPQDSSIRLEMSTPPRPWPRQHPGSAVGSEHAY